MTLRTSAANAKNGITRSQLRCHSAVIVGYFASQRAANSANCRSAVARHVTGSSLVQAFTREDRLGQESSAEQLDAGASIHLALQHFEPVNVSFHGSIAPPLSDCGFYCAEVLFQSAHEAYQGMNARLPRPLHPAMQRGQLAYTQDGAKAQNQSAHHRKTRALPFQSVNKFSLLRSQFCADLAQQRRRQLRRDLSRCWRWYFIQ